MSNKEMVYAPENQNEEALMLMGRVNAFAAFVRTCKYSIPCEEAAAILGFELDEDVEEDGQ